MPSDSPAALAPAVLPVPANKRLVAAAGAITLPSAGMGSAAFLAGTMLSLSLLAATSVTASAPGGAGLVSVTQLWVTSWLGAPLMLASNVAAALGLAGLLVGLFVLSRAGVRARLIPTVRALAVCSVPTVVVLLAGAVWVMHSSDSSDLPQTGTLFLTTASIAGMLAAMGAATWPLVIDRAEARLRRDGRAP